MKMVKIEVENGKTVITTESYRLFLKPKIRRFLALRQVTEHFCEWLELPNKKLVGDALSFQLDSWKESEVKL